MHDIANNAHDDNAVPPAQHLRKSNGTPIPAHLSDRVDELCEILGKIGSKEVDVKAGKLAVLRLALDAGDHLIAIEKDVAHRKLGAWVQANLNCTARTARKYMRLADDRALIEEQIGTGSVFSIRGALRLINSKKPARPGHAAVNDPVVPTTRPVTERAALIASLAITIDDVPASVKADIVAHAVAQTQRTTDKHETENRDLAWECVGAIRRILATQARSECKIEDIANALRTILKRTLPVMDRKASYH